jgi:hypothetical protein
VLLLHRVVMFVVRARTPDEFISELAKPFAALQLD